MNLRPRLASVTTCLGLFLCSGSAAVSAEIGILSGEHEDFSRLVVQFQERVNWEFGRVEGGYEFRSDDPEATFVLTTIFQRIPRTRISDVADLGNGRLFLESDCNCYGDAFDLRDGEIVLDIKDGEPRTESAPYNTFLEPASMQAVPSEIPSDSMADQALPLSPVAPPMDVPFDNIEMPAEMEPPPEETAQIQRASDRAGLPLILPESPPVQTLDVAKAVTPPPHTSEPLDLPDEPMFDEEIDIPFNADDPVSQRVTEVETGLLEQIGRATTQGLLEPNIAETQRQIDRASTAMGTTPSGAQDEPAPTEFLIEPGPEDHMQIQTAADQAREALHPVADMTADGQNCLGDAYFDIPEWGGDISDGTQIGTYRSGLMGEFDRANSESIQELARHYIYLTFGTEAKALVNAFPAELERPDLLLVLAEIVNDQYAINNELLEPYLSCDGKVALWAALAQPEFKPSHDINTHALSAAFSELPLHLRRYLGPTLATRFLDVGDVQTAKSLRNAIDRASGEHGAGFNLLDAQIAIDQDRTESAVSTLTDVVRGDTVLAPGAILDLIEFKIENDIEITEREIANAASHAFEHRGTETGNDLIQAEIMALAATASFADTFSRLDGYKSQGRISLETENDILDHIYRNLVIKGQDSTFLRYIIDLPANIPLSPTLRYDVAKRLNDLGFSQDAREILGRSAQVPNLNERRLFATIAINENKYDVALGYLTGLEEDKDIILRAQALAGKESLLEASQLFERAGDPDNQLQTAWRAGEWAQVADLDQGAAGRASTLMLAEPETPNTQTETPGSLNAGTALLSESEQTREIISDLLDTFSLP